MSGSDDDCYGPVLPPSMKKSITKENSSNKERDSSGDDTYGPTLPPSMITPSGQATSRNQSSSSSPAGSTIGPTLPPSTAASTSAASASASAAGDGDASSSDDDAYGPALPPGFVKRPSAPTAPPPPAVRGPVLPPGGLPPPQDDDDEDIIGPRPPGEAADLGRYAAAEVERRASSMKEKLDAMGRPVELVREEWMLELPPDRAGEFGLGPRQFRKKTPHERGDTSAWTDTPDGKAQPRPAAAAKPAKQGGELVELATRQRDERMAQVAEDLGAKRKESLMDLHQKSAKKAKKAAVAAGENPDRRQEFDRDRDMGSNRFDDAQRSAAIKRSRGASDMFSSGAQKFL